MLVSSVRIPKGGRGAFASKSEVQRETLVVVAAPRELETGSRDGRVLGEYMEVERSGRSVGSVSAQPTQTFTATPTCKLMLCRKWPDSGATSRS